MSNFDIWFDHGLGDCVHIAHVLELYRRHGHIARVHFEGNKSDVFRGLSFEYIDCPGQDRYCQFGYHAEFNQPTLHDSPTGNKVASNMFRSPFPPIGIEGDQAWSELCRLSGSLRLSESVVTADLVDQARRWLAALPRPIILLHTTGTNMPETKNIPDDTIAELYQRLLSESGGSLVLLDWDFRVPTLDDAAVRHVKRDWGHLSVAQLVAIMQQSDLLIGVDSGPYHLASMVDIPAIGVFHHHYPSCVTLPNPRAVNMTRESYRDWNIARRSSWNVIEYPGHLPSACDIAKAARRMLAKPVFTGHRVRDTQLLQFIEDWQSSGTSLSENADRSRTWRVIFDHLSQVRSPVIVETGCSRSGEDWSAGYSTYLFSWFLHFYERGQLHSVDIDQGNLRTAHRVTSGINNRTQFICLDSLKFLQNCGDAIDLLYLDSLDADSPGHAEHGLHEIQTALTTRLGGRNPGSPYKGLPESIVGKNCMVVFDDTTWKDGRFQGKGSLAVPWLVDHGWRVVSAGYQVCLKQQGVADD